MNVRCMDICNAHLYNSRSKLTRVIYLLMYNIQCTMYDVQYTMYNIWTCATIWCAALKVGCGDLSTPWQIIGRILFAFHLFLLLTILSFLNYHCLNWIFHVHGTNQTKVMKIGTFPHFHLQKNRSLWPQLWKCMKWQRVLPLKCFSGMSVCRCQQRTSKGPHWEPNNQIQKYNRPNTKYIVLCKLM